MQFTLRNPITLETGDVMTKLTLRRSLKVGDIYDATARAKGKDGKGMADNDRFLAEAVASMCGMTFTDVLGLDIRDFEELQDHYVEIRYPKKVEAEETESALASTSASTPTKGSKK